MTDRLFLGLNEARSHEPLSLLGENLPGPDLARFYRQLSEAEARHADLFRALASLYDGGESVDDRLTILARAEADIAASLPLLPRIH